MKKNIILIIGIILVLIFCRFLTGYLNSIKTKANISKSKIPQVTVDVVKSIDIQRKYETTARVVSKYRVDVLARINGYLTKSYFKEGDYVKAGQVLFEIEPQEYEYARNKAKANLDNITSQADYYNKQLVRYKELVEQDYVAKSEYDNVLAQSDAYKAQVESAMSAYRDAQRNYSYTKIKSPVDGRVGIIDVTVGNYVTTAIGALTTINSTNPMYVTFPLDSKDYAELVRIDKSANVNRKVEFLFSSGEKYQLSGVQDFRDNKIEESTGTITLRATFDNPNDELIQGDFGRAIIYSNNKDTLPVISQSATMENQEGLFAYVLDENNLPRMRYIKTMGTVDNKWIVYEGLKIGDRVITSGLQKIMPGAPVKIIDIKALENNTNKKVNPFKKFIKYIESMLRGK